MQVVADTPVGAFLSAGIDSSTVVALMQATSSSRSRTFSIGLKDSEHSESKEAGRIARYLGTEHTEFVVSPQEAMDSVQLMPFVYDEPFANHGQIPMYLVCKLARSDVKVVLSGDGGDELFQGYRYYRDIADLKSCLDRFPVSVRRGLASVGKLAPVAALDRLSRFVPAKVSQGRLGDRLLKLAAIAGQDTNDIYLNFLSVWSDNLVLGCEPAMSPIDEVWSRASGLSFQEQMRATDLCTVLPDSHLTKVDRASMAVSLEVRVPLLDHRLIEWSWQIPQEWKVHNGIGKRILRDVLYRYVPRDLLDRPKTGFGLPLDEWLRGPMREWAENLLCEQKIRDQGFLNPAVVTRTWQEHLSGNRNWLTRLWTVLMFQAWLEEWGGISNSDTHLS